MRQEREKIDVEACCWEYLSKQGNACVVSAIVNASCSLPTELAPHVHQEELIFNYPILCICPSLIQKKKHQREKKAIQDGRAVVRPIKQLIIGAFTSVTADAVFLNLISYGNNLNPVFTPPVRVWSILAVFCGKELPYAPMYGRKFQLGKFSSLKLSA